MFKGFVLRCSSACLVFVPFPLLTPKPEKFVVCRQICTGSFCFGRRICHGEATLRSLQWVRSNRVHPCRTTLNSFKYLGSQSSALHSLNINLKAVFQPHYSVCRLLSLSPGADHHQSHGAWTHQDIHCSLRTQPNPFWCSRTTVWTTFVVVEAHLHLPQGRNHCEQEQINWQMELNAQQNSNETSIKTKTLCAAPVSSRKFLHSAKSFT